MKIKTDLRNIGMNACVVILLQIRNYFGMEWNIWEFRLIIVLMQLNRCEYFKELCGSLSSSSSRVGISSFSNTKLEDIINLDDVLIILNKSEMDIALDVYRISNEMLKVES